ncbi:DUF1570 domain-containing protein [Engelhardtia mirabilis]|uniref:DUF1570 domain-containing protein n=1 Tax=Engelhardtia mirabilis TaxID=2528011 RepID=A0A518BR21_9BACT|nr:hypothetical protein Pla133_45510 [Planctomycetes bacterium Pla133]QDV03757.1 hypothetical protein Pla86_45490 [Planctomycetes bacterium Pla86]
MSHEPSPARFHALASGLVLALLTLLPAADRDRAEDTLVPVKGREVEGYLIHQGDREIIFRVGTRDRIWEVEDVEEVRSPALLYNELAQRLRRAPLGDVEGAVQIAKWAQEVGLEAEARYAWWRVLAFNWDNEEAHTALGSKSNSEGWRVRIDRKWLTREKFLERIVDWDTPFEIDLSFHEIRASSLLEDSLAAVDATVLTFDMLYREFGGLFELPFPQKVMEVHLHGDTESFPPMNRRAAYFRTAENRVVCDCSMWEGLSTLAHELMHQLLSNAYQMVDDGRGSPPGWFDEGLAEIAAALVEVEAHGLSSLLETERARIWLRIHAQAEEPYELSRVLNFDQAQFHAVDGSELAYAQAFTLVLFLLQADEGTYVEGFRAFVASTFEGKGSGTHFQNAMDMKLEDLEARWIGYVQARAQGDD